MPEGNRTHRRAELPAGKFAGKKVHGDSPRGRCMDAGPLDGRNLVGAMAAGKASGYDFGAIDPGARGPREIVHVRMGLYGDFTEGQQRMPELRVALRMRIWDKVPAAGAARAGGGEASTAQAGEVLEEEVPCIDRRKGRSCSVCGRGG